MISNINSVSFKGYVPVRYFAKNNKDGSYYPIYDKDKIKKCNNYIVRNLNGTAGKNSKNDELVDKFSSYDKDYKEKPYVRSVCDRGVVYLVTGKDANKLPEYAKPIGIAKSESLDAFGHSESHDAKLRTREYFANVKSFLKNTCIQIKGGNDKPLTLNAYFDPQYKNGELKDYKYNSLEFVDEEKLSPHKNTSQKQIEEKKEQEKSIREQKRLEKEAEEKRAEEKKIEEKPAQEEQYRQMNIFDYMENPNKVEKALFEMNEAVNETAEKIERMSISDLFEMTGVNIFSRR